VTKNKKVFRYDPKSTTRMRVRWDEIASQFPDLYPAASTKYYRNREIDLILRSFGKLQNKRVLKLDLWNEAVNTRILNWMNSQGAEVYGLDISSLTTIRARQNSQDLNGRLNLAQADIRLIPFDVDSFDFVYTMGTVEHTGEYQQAINEVFRVLKPGGKAIIGVPYKWDIFLRPLIVKTLEIFGLYPYSPEKSFSWPELCTDIENSGLIVRRRTGILFMPGLLRMIDVFLFRRGINLFGFMQLILRPFEFIEKKWKWSHHLCYLVAAEAEKSPPGI